VAAHRRDEHRLERDILQLGDFGLEGGGEGVGWGIGGGRGGGGVDGEGCSSGARRPDLHRLQQLHAPAQHNFQLLLLLLIRRYSLGFCKGRGNY